MDNVTSIYKHRPPLGAFHAVSCRDHSSVERDGQSYYACNELSTSTGRREVEIQFADGTWLLADPDMDLVMVPSNRQVGS